MTMTRPWRRITLHFSHIAFTLGRTFTVSSPDSYRFDSRAQHRADVLCSTGCPTPTGPRPGAPGPVPAGTTHL